MLILLANISGILAEPNKCKIIENTQLKTTLFNIGK